MAHFAKVENDLVTQVIVAEQDFINSGVVGHGWIQTSYNTHGGVHYNGGTPLRANYAGIGYTYDSVNDVFYSERPLDMNGQLCNSWTISAPTWLWTPPIPCPTDGKMYGWDEATASWVEIAP